MSSHRDPFYGASRGRLDEGTAGDRAGWGLETFAYVSMLTLAASLSKCDNFGASDLSVFEFVEGVAECGDFEGGFGWGELAGVEDEVGLGHGEG